MTTLCTTHPNGLAARRAVDALRATGVPERDIRLLTGREPHDVRREPVGGFAGPVIPDAPVGTFGGATVPRRRGAGGFAGDPDHQRQGSFADSDRVLITTYHEDAERVRINGVGGVHRLLGRAGVDGETVHHAVNELRLGQAVVLIDLRDVDAIKRNAQLEQVANAA